MLKVGQHPKVATLTSHDGSHTLESEAFGVTYHSHFGAIEESLTVFISAGLEYQRQRGLSKVNILEIGFGTGLNAYLTLVVADSYGISCKYQGIEAYPIDTAVAEKLNYPELIDDAARRAAFLAMHAAPANEPTSISEGFTFTKRVEKIEEMQLTQGIDIVYFDAFAPSAQPELWKPDILAKIYDACSPQAVLTTYCAQGQFKRDLRSVGFTVEALPGPGRKREMTRAIKLS